MKKILILILVLFFIIGCTKAPDQQVKRKPVTVRIGEPSPTPSPQQPPVQQPTQSVKEFNIQARQFEFNPSTITVNRGDRVKLIITSIDVTHGFSIPDFNIQTTLSPGDTIVKEFTADKAGTFEFRCSIYCGSGHPGMKGILIVNP